MNEENSTLHEKAMVLVKGGIVEISGLRVKMRHEQDVFNPCFRCDMDPICHSGNDISELCQECDLITGEDCSLIIYE